MFLLCLLDSVEHDFCPATNGELIAVLPLNLHRAAILQETEMRPVYAVLSFIPPFSGHLNLLITGSFMS